MNQNQSLLPQDLQECPKILLICSKFIDALGETPDAVRLLFNCRGGEMPGLQVMVPADDSIWKIQTLRHVKVVMNLVT